MLVEQAQGEAETVQDGGPVVAVIGLVDGFAPLLDVGAEGGGGLGLAVEVDDGDLVGRVAKDVGEHGFQVAILFELMDRRSAGLHEDDKREGLVGGSIQGYLLGYTVVCYEEVCGAE